MSGRSLLLGGVLLVGAAGITLEVVGAPSPIRSALLLSFVILGPSVAIAGLLRGFDPLARVVLAVTSDLVFLTLVAMIMVSTGHWSPTAGLLAVAALTGLCQMLQWPPFARRLRTTVATFGRR